MENDLCSFHTEFAQQTLGILNGIRNDVKWMLKIGGFALIVIGGMISLSFPVIKDLVLSINELRQELRIHESRVTALEKNDEKLLAIKDRRDEQILAILKRLEQIDPRH